MSVLERLGKVVKAEWSHRFQRPRSPGDPAGASDDGAAREMPARKPAVVDVDGALRVLELSVLEVGGAPALADVRAHYRRLARRYYPKTQSANADEAHAARVVLEALTDAVELLEEHLLAMPPR